jgi:hypothetical protein
MLSNAVEGRGEMRLKIKEPLKTGEMGTSSMKLYLLRIGLLVKLINLQLKDIANKIYPNYSIQCKSSLLFQMHF